MLWTNANLISYSSVFMLSYAKYFPNGERYPIPISYDGNKQISTDVSQT